MDTKIESLSTIHMKISLIAPVFCPSFHPFHPCAHLFLFISEFHPSVLKLYTFYLICKCQFMTDCNLVRDTIFLIVDEPLTAWLGLCSVAIHTRSICYIYLCKYCFCCVKNINPTQYCVAIRNSIMMCNV